MAFKAFKSTKFISEFKNEPFYMCIVSVFLDIRISLMRVKGFLVKRCFCNLEMTMWRQHSEFLRNFFFLVLSHKISFLVWPQMSVSQTSWSQASRSQNPWSHTSGSQTSSNHFKYVLQASWAGQTRCPRWPAVRRVPHTSLPPQIPPS